MLDDTSYRARYPNGVSDYTVGVRKPDGTMTFIDAQKDAQTRQSTGLAGFMNHNRARANVARRTLFDTVDGVPRVLMYSTRDIAPGEEIQWGALIAGHAALHSPQKLLPHRSRAPATARHEPRRAPEHSGACDS